MASKSSRILILATSYLPLIGGAELAVKNITDRLPELQFDLVTGRYDTANRYDPSLPAVERIGNVNIYRVGWNGGGTKILLPKAILPLAIFQKAWRLLRQNEYDMGYALQASQAAGALWLLKLFRVTHIPFVLGIQEGKDLNKQSWLLKWFRRLIFGAADHFIVISSYLKTYLQKEGIHEKKITVIPNGVDSALFSRQAGPSPFEMGGSPGHAIMTISRLVPKNGLGDLIEGFHIFTENSPSDTNLVIIGGGPLEYKLKEQARLLSCASRIHFLGEIAYEELPAYLSHATVFVRPALSEGLGTAFLEAMAVGVPVIGTPVGGIPDFLVDGETGLFCHPHDPASVAAALTKLMSNENLCQKIISNAQNLIREKYEWDHIAQSFKKIYASVTNC